MQLDDYSLQAILDVIPVAAHTPDAAGLITYSNPLALVVCGRAPKQREPREVYCASQQLYLSDGTGISHAQCWMAPALAEGAAYHGRALVIEREDGP